MFSGIVRAKGRVVSLTQKRGGGELRIRIASGRVGVLRIGDSVSVSGVCLTIVSRRGKTLVFDLLPETFKRTHFAGLRSGDAVNLEPSLRYGDRMHGHAVSGHVEGTVRIRGIVKRGRTATWSVAFPRRLRRAIVFKGSVALEGVSLTIGRISGLNFEVHLIPHTLRSTNLRDKKRGDALNIETDSAHRRL